MPTDICRDRLATVSAFQRIVGSSLALFLPSATDAFESAVCVATALLLLGLYDYFVNSVDDYLSACVNDIMRTAQVFLCKSHLIRALPQR